MPIRSCLGLALSLVVVSTTLFATPAEGKECEVVKEGDGKKWKRAQNRKCLANCLYGAPTTVVHGGIVIMSSTFTLILGSLTATNADRYYLELSTAVDMKRIEGDKEYAVRAAQDPLVVVFEDRSEMQLYPACNASSVAEGDKRNQHYCAPYIVTRENLEELASKKIYRLKQFVDANEELKGARLKRTGDGRSYFDIILKERHTANLTRPASCMLDSK